MLEEVSGLKVGIDFKIGYSPERINPGDKVHTLANTVKIVSGCDAETLETVAKVYELVVRPGVHRAPKIISRILRWLRPGRLLKIHNGM